MAPDQASEDLAWKTIEGRATGCERSNVTRLARLATCRRLRDRCRCGMHRWSSRADRPADLGGDVVGDNRARANFSVEIPFLQQLVERAEHGVALNLQFLGKGSCRWQALTWAQPPRRDRRTHSLVDLQIEGHWGGSIERNDGDHSDARGSTHVRSGDARMLPRPYRRRSRASPRA